MAENGISLNHARDIIKFDSHGKLLHPCNFVSFLSRCPTSRLSRPLHDLGKASPRRRQQRRELDDRTRQAQQQHQQ